RGAGLDEQGRAAAADREFRRLRSRYRVGARHIDEPLRYQKLRDPRIAGDDVCKVLIKLRNIESARDCPKLPIGRVVEIEGPESRNGPFYCRHCSASPYRVRRWADPALLPGRKVYARRRRRG